MDQIAELPGLEVRGLMTIGRLVERADDARPTFRALREASDRLRAAGAPLGGELSMGMTDDFEVAVEEGATIVRVGRALFGERSHDHDRRRPSAGIGAGPAGLTSSVARATAPVAEPASGPLAPGW